MESKCYIIGLSGTDRGIEITCGQDEQFICRIKSITDLQNFYAFTLNYTDQFMASSSMDFPNDYTTDNATLRLVDQIRNFDPEAQADDHAPETRIEKPMPDKPQFAKAVNRDLIMPTWKRLDTLSGLVRKSMLVSKNIKRTLDEEFDPCDAAEIEQAIDLLDSALENIDTVAMHFEMDIRDEDEYAIRS
jgi:hypothetical protein